MATHFVYRTVMDGPILARPSTVSEDIVAQLRQEHAVTIRIFEPSSASSLKVFRLHKSASRTC